MSPNDCVGQRVPNLAEIMKVKLQYVAFTKPSSELMFPLFL